MGCWRSGGRRRVLRGRARCCECVLWGRVSARYLLRRAARERAVRSLLAAWEGQYLMLAAVAWNVWPHWPQVLM